jgi:hypothetical protein
MRRIVVLVSLTFLLNGCTLSPEEKAVSAIHKSDGEVMRDEKLSGQPVVDVNLVGTQLGNRGRFPVFELLQTWRCGWFVVGRGTLPVFGQFE